MNRVIVGFFCLASCALAVDPATPAPKAPMFESTTTSGIHHITFKARIDADAEIIIQDGRMFLDSKGSKPAENITVNGRKWNVVYTNGISEDFKFGSPLQPFNGKPVTARLTKTRGSVDIRQQPTAENGNKLVIHLQDSAAGPGNFDLLITW